MNNRYNRISRKTSAADTLKRRLAGTKAKATAQTVDDAFAQAVGRKLESRGIARVPGLPSPEPEPTWVDRAIEFGRRTKELEEEREARRKAEAENAPQTTAGILISEIARAATGSGSVQIPLNGAQVLRAALAGGQGTINSGND